MNFSLPQLGQGGQVETRAGSFIHETTRSDTWDFLWKLVLKRIRRKGLQVWEGGQGSLWLSMPWEVPRMCCVWEWWLIEKWRSVVFQFSLVWWSMGLYLWGEKEVFFSVETFSIVLRNYCWSSIYPITCHVFISLFRCLISTPGLCAGDTAEKQTGTAPSYGLYSPIDWWVCEPCLCKTHR